MKDDYKRAAAAAREYGRKARKAISRTTKATQRQAVRAEPTEPEVHPAEIELSWVQANCKHVPDDGWCLRCGAHVWSW